MRTIGRWALRALTRLEVEGGDLVPADGPCIFAVNHRSLLDGALIGILLPRPCAALVAEEWHRRAWVRVCLAAFPVLIPLSRTGSGWQGLLAALGVLERGQAVAICPEGRVSRDGLRRAHPGVVWLAAAAGAPVVPTVIHGAERAVSLWRSPRRPLLRVRFGEPIVCDRAAPRQAQADRLMRAMAALLPPRCRGLYGRVPLEERSR